MAAKDVKVAALEIAKLSEDMDPAEFVTACGMAAASIIRVCWRPEDRAQCIKGYAQALLLALKD